MYMTIRKVQNDKALLEAFARYQMKKSRGVKFDFRKFFPEIVYRTMRLEGEHITRQEAQALFQ